VNLDRDIDSAGSCPNSTFFESTNASGFSILLFRPITTFRRKKDCKLVEVVGEFMNMPGPGYRLFAVIENFQVFSPYNRKKLIPVTKSSIEEVWADTETGGDDVKVWVDERDLRAEPILFARCTRIKVAS
jgi:hypothetical protein